MPLVVERRKGSIGGQDDSQQCDCSHNKFPRHIRIRAVRHHPENNHRNAESEGAVDKPPAMLP